MDNDTEDDYDRPRLNLSEVKKNLLEIAQNRPGTHAAKAILAHHESPGLGTMLMLLEEVSKNTDFSTDLRLSLTYYMDEFLRQISGLNVSSRSTIAAAGNVLQYCSKIYGDRVELLFQVVENQIEALLMADPKKEETSSNGPDEPKKEEPRKRRVKKLAQRHFDPFTYKMEPKKFKMMSEEKRFSCVGVEESKNRTRTIEHMFQDHTPAYLWKHAPLIDPKNPYEQDEKKNYKLFTYYPEPRYNTLLPDIPFDRINLIKEYLHNNHMDVSDTLNENMSSREYLDHYIALENKMIAARYGERIELKRPSDDRDDEQAKRMRLTEQQEDMEDSDMEADMFTDLDTNDSALQTQISVDSALGDTLNRLSLNASEMEGPALSSTLEMNDSSCLDSTRLNQELSLETSQELNLMMSHGLQQTSAIDLPDEATGAECSQQLLQMDSGIDMDDVSDMLHTAQSFDDEGVVLADNIDEQRLQSLSPKAMVHDIPPGVPDKDNLSVCVDGELLGLFGIHDTTVEEIMTVPREVRYPIERNLFQLPEKKLRRNCLFKLTNDFELFKAARMPTKRTAEPKAPVVVKPLRMAPSPTPSLDSFDSFDSIDLYPELPDDQLEFDSESNFLGFRRATYDSGYEYEELIAYSSSEESDLLDTIEAGTQTDYIDDYALSRGLKKLGKDMSLHEIPASAAALYTESFHEMETSVDPADTVDDTTISLELLIQESELDAIDIAKLDLEVEKLDLDGAKRDMAIDMDNCKLNLDTSAPGEINFDSTEKFDAELNAAVKLDAELDTAENGDAELYSDEKGEVELDAAEKGDVDTAEKGVQVDFDAAEKGDIELDSAEKAVQVDLDAADTDCESEDMDLINSENCNTIDEETEAKIIDWHRRLAPTLEAAHDRQNFSIQDLNDEIINKCQEGNGQATLADVMEDKDPTKRCCYLLSALLLTNQRNVALKLDKRDETEPIDMHQLQMKLLSTERRQLNPEDDIGNVKKAKPCPSISDSSGTAESLKAVRRKATQEESDSDEPIASVNVKKIMRLIQPVPRSSARQDDADSGISSLQSL